MKRFGGGHVWAVVLDIGRYDAAAADGCACHVGADAWLFRPEAAIRTRAASDQGTPVPMDEPLAPNPPEGRGADYFLKDKPATTIQMEIFDG